MATAYGWGVRQSNNNNNNNNNNDNNNRKRPFAATSTYSCQFCEKVFTSTLALLDHYESHRVDTMESLSRNVRQQQDQMNHLLSQMAENRPLTNSLQPNFPIVMPPRTSNPAVNVNAQALRERNNHFLRVNPRFNAFELLPESDNLGSHISSRSYGPPLKMQRRANITEPEANDYTRPFLDQLLYKPAESGTHRTYPSNHQLDLTLKL